MSDAVVAAIAAIVGGVLTKTVDYLFTSDDREYRQDANWRAEQRKEIERLTERLDLVEARLDKRTAEYYQVLGEKAKVEAELAKVRAELVVVREHADRLAERVTKLENGGTPK